MNKKKLTGKCIGAYLVTVLIQFIILNAMVKAMEDLVETPFCAENMDYMSVFASALVFLVSIVPAVRDLQRELYILLFSTRAVDVIGEDKLVWIELHRGGWNIILPAIVLFVELLVTLTVVWVGLVRISLLFSNIYLLFVC